MSLETAIKLYQICKEADVPDNDVKMREIILLLLSERGDVDISETGRSREEILSDYGKHYKKVLYIVKKKEVI